jgi:predicted Zn-dependent protease
MMKKQFLRGGLLWIMITAIIVPSLARAQNAPAIIRDSEIEDIIAEWTEPVLKAAGMNKDSVKIIIVQSPSLNAFVAGGANVFFYTGLIERTDNPGELIGVFAHELGHITGGHLIRSRDAMERASYESILGTVLGLGAAMATGNGAVASAIISGSSNIAQRNYLSHSRVNESSADQAALTFLKAAEMNPSGLASFLEKLESEELLPASQQSEYVRTHPLTSDRVDAVENGGKSSVFINKAWPDRWIDQHARMKAKLVGFINPGSVPWAYSDSDISMPARYARAIAAYRQNNIEEALKLSEALIGSEPENPYFQELKGQMLVDFGRVGEAVPYYKRAVELKSDAPLIRIAYAHALMESKGSIAEAKDNLERALRDEPNSSRAYRLLATAYGREGREDIAKLYLAEEALLQRNYDYAKRQAEGALNTLPKGSREWLKAKDVLEFIANQAPEKN